MPFFERDLITSTCVVWGRWIFGWFLDGVELELVVILACRQENQMQSDSSQDEPRDEEKEETKWAIPEEKDEEKEEVDGA